MFSRNNAVIFSDQVNGSTEESFKALPMHEAEAKERMSKGGEGKEILPALEKGQSRDQAAAQVGVSGKYISDVKRIEREAPE